MAVTLSSFILNNNWFKNLAYLLSYFSNHFNNNTPIHKSIHILPYICIFKDIKVIILIILKIFGYIFIVIGGRGMKKTILIFLLLMIIIVPFLIDKGFGQSTITTQDIDFNNKLDIEKYLAKIINLEDLNDEEVRKIILSLPDLNWDKLNKHGKKFKKNFVNWIEDKNIDEVDEISALIEIMNKFSKEDYERLSKVLANIFIEDKVSFIKALSLKKGHLMELGYAIYDLGLYEEGGRYLTDDFNEILNSEELTKEEKFLGFEFIDIIASCAT